MLSIKWLSFLYTAPYSINPLFQYTIVEVRSQTSNNMTSFPAETGFNVRNI